MGLKRDSLNRCEKIVLEVLENKILRKIFGPERDEVAV
jgi:hypothetical protein